MMYRVYGELYVPRTKWIRQGVASDKPKAVIDQFREIRFCHNKEGIPSDTIQIQTPGRQETGHSQIKFR